MLISDWSSVVCSSGLLPVKSYGVRYVSYGTAKGLQSHVALRFDADWLHIKQDTPMPPPRFKAQELADFIKKCQVEQVPVTLGVGIFQDGSLGPQALPVLREVRRLVRGKEIGRAHV